MPMDVNTELEVKNYVEQKEKEQADTLGVLGELKNKLKDEAEKGDDDKWHLFKWLRNDENLLTYAKLVMDWEKFSFKHWLLELKLSVTCPYFADFKDFLEELKRWTVSSSSTETTNESSEILGNTFCWTSVGNIESEPYEKNSETWVTWCSKTARNNWKNFWIILPSWNAYDAWCKPWNDCIKSIPENKKDKRPQKSWKWIESSQFTSITKWNYADIYTDSKSSYGHRAAAFKDDNWQWYILDPYTRVNWRLDNSPKRLEDYLGVRKIVKAHIYESRWYVLDSQEVADNPQVEKAVQWAIGIAEDNCHWYERWGKGESWQYDCSGLVTNAFKQAWFNVPISWTATMRENFTKVWFEWISPYDSSKLKRWDIVLKDKWADGERHTEIYTWNWKFVWARSNKDWKSWDSSWNEIAETSANRLNTFGRNWILRYKW